MTGSATSFGYDRNMGGVSKFYLQPAAVLDPKNLIVVR